MHFEFVLFLGLLTEMELGFPFRDTAPCTGLIANSGLQYAEGPTVFCAIMCPYQLSYCAEDSKTPPALGMAAKCHLWAKADLTASRIFFTPAIPTSFQPVPALLTSVAPGTSPGIWSTGAAGVNLEILPSQSWW